MYQRASRYLLLVMAPLVLTIFIFAHDLLSIWLGPRFADQGELITRILAGGMLANALAQLPFGLVQALGRPDLTAKLHMIELVPFLALAYELIVRFGVVGAALAWALRATFDFVGLVTIARSVLPRPAAGSLTLFARRVLLGVALMVAIAGASVMVEARSESHLAWGALAIAVYTGVSTFVILDGDDRLQAIARLQRFAGSVRGL